MPPDTHGDVGPTQYLASVNLHLRSFSKATGTADGVVDVDLDTFFASVAGCTPSCLSDPRVIYDRIAQRWVIVLITVDFSTTVPIHGNRVLIATSNTSTITNATVWTKYFFQQDLVTPVGNTGQLCDYPNAGLDVNAIYIGCDMFDNNFYYGSTVFVVRKSTVYSGGPIVVSTFRNLIAPGGANPSGAGPNTPKGVTNFDPAATVGFFIGEDNQLFGKLQLLKITTPGGTPALAPQAINVAAFQTPIPVTAKLTPDTGAPFHGKIDGNDNRVMNAEIINGDLWLAHGTALNSAGNGGTGSPDRNGVRWYQFTTPATAPTALQTGTIFDSTATVDSYTYGSINVNGQGHAAIGFTIIGPNTFPGAAFDGRLAADANSTTQGVQTAFAGQGAYNGSGFDTGQFQPRRWGDFSNTSIDPSDNMTFWTVQEYSLANGSWATRVVKLLSKPPATPTLATPSSIPAGQAAVSVTVTGTQVSGSGFYDGGAAFPLRIGAQIIGGAPGVVVNSVTYNSPTSVTLSLNTVGSSTGAHDVKIINPDGQFLTGIGLLTVTAGGGTASSTALGSSLNPSTVGAAVTFTATVTGSSGTPTGTVTFKDGAATIAGASLNGSGVAAFATSVLTAGTHSITAVYGGDSTYLTSTSAPVSQVVKQAPAITSANATTFTAGTAGTFTVTTTGSPVPAITKVGALPSGVTFVDNGNGTATLAGTATVAGSYPLTITANNGVAPNANQSFTLTVNAGAPASIVVFSGGGQIEPRRDGVCAAARGAGEGCEQQSGAGCDRFMGDADIGRERESHPAAFAADQRQRAGDVTATANAISGVYNVVAQTGALRSTSVSRTRSRSRWATRAAASR